MIENKRDGHFGSGFSLTKTASITKGEMKGENIMKQTAEKIKNREPVNGVDVDKLFETIDAICGGRRINTLPQLP